MSQITQQSGVASSTPSPLYRWLASKLMTKIGSEQTQNRARRKAEKKRQKEGRPHRVEYFHQVGDGYSYLAAQLLERIAARYDIELIYRLVRPEAGANTPEPDLLEKLSLYDANLIAEHYGLTAPGAKDLPPKDLQAQALAILAALPGRDFAAIAPGVEAALWHADEAEMLSLAATLGNSTEKQRQAKLDEGTERRRTLGHYSGAMFYYEGEWYWGVDRLYHLEKRLADLGADRNPGAPLLAPRPVTEFPATCDDGSITLEYYPSLRSPYTAVSWEPTMQLAERAGITLVIKPVLPMVMRGVPATRQKGMYIFRDTAREARALGVPFGRFYDPIGDPVKRCYALYPWACKQGKGTALLGAFLRAAFTLGINTNRTAGLKKVVAMAGLDWKEAQQHLGDDSWRGLLEQNRQDMYDFGSWGVPSYRLLDEEGKQVLGVWGQDRLWLVSREIARLLKAREAGPV